jgi:hypothetical protein
MWFFPWLDFPKSASPPRPASRVRRCCPRRWSAGPKLFLERLEDRSLPSVVGPLPIPGGRLVPNPFGGPDGHFNMPGHADSTVPGVGGEPASITDFNGFVGDVRVDGTGTDGSGNTLLWEVDLRFMKGVYVGVDGNVHQGTFALV